MIIEYVDRTYIVGSMLTILHCWAHILALLVFELVNIKKKLQLQGPPPLPNYRTFST